MLNETNLELHRVILEQAQALRPLPQAVLDLARTVNAPDTGLKDVAECLRTDPVLTAVVLREANSAFVGAREPAATIEAAVVRLGGARVLAIAVGSSLPSEITQALPGYGIFEGGLQAHAVACSHAAEVIRSMSQVPLPPSVVTAALLHDIGKILLGRLLRPQLIPTAIAQGSLITSAERSLFDLDHGEVGAALVAHWKLPDEIVTAIQWHHEPGLSGVDLSYGVALADSFAHQAMGDQPGAGAAGEVSDGAAPLGPAPDGPAGPEATADPDRERIELSAEALGIDPEEAARKVTERLDRAGLLPMAFTEG